MRILLLLVLASVLSAQELTLRVAPSLFVTDMADGSAKGGDSVSLGAARGEAEPFVALISDGTGALRAEVDLASIASDVRFVEQVSAAVPKDRALARKRKYPSRTEMTSGTYANRLLPLGDAPQRGPVLLWVTLRVPETAHAGDIEGTLRIWRGTARASAKVKLTVWDFALPRAMAFRFTAGIPRVREFIDRPEVQRSWAENFAAHRISNRELVRPALRIDGGRVEIDWEEFDAQVERLVALGMNWFEFPHAYVVGGHGERYVQTFGRVSREEMSDDFKRNYVSAVREIAAHLKTRGWLDRFMVMISDEPYPEQDEETKAIARLVMEAAPDLKPAAPGPLPRASLSGFLKHWITPAYVLDPAWTDGPRKITLEQIEVSRDVLARDIEAGVPWSVYNPIEDYGLASAPVEQRSLYWWCWRARVHSMLQWTVHAGNRTPKTVRDWDSLWVDVARDGSLIDTVRWEATRDGLEDYAYLAALERKEGREAADALCARIARAITDRSTDPQALLDARAEMGKALAEK